MFPVIAVLPPVLLSLVTANLQVMIVIVQST